MGVSDGWILVPDITEEFTKRDCGGRDGCDHDDLHWMAFVGLSESEESELQSTEDLFNFYVKIIAKALEISYADAKHRIYLASTGSLYGFCLKFEGSPIRVKLESAKKVLLAVRDCDWKSRQYDPYQVKKKKDENKENIAVKVSLGPRKSTKLNTAFKGTSKSRKVIENLRRVTGHAHGPLREITDYSQGMRPRRFSDRNGQRGGYNHNSSHASQPNMEGKSKSSQKSTFVGHVPMGTDAVSVLAPSDRSTDSIEEADQLQEKFSRVTVSEGEDVNQVDLLNGQVESSGSASPASVTVSEQPSPDNKESQSTWDLESYADIGMVRNDNPSYAPEKTQQHDPSLPSFAAYDPQTGYDIPFCRPLTDDSVRIQSVPSPGEAAMIQQPTIPQMYPQVHVSHFPNRQFPSPVYMPPMAVPGYPSYLLMPGGSSQLAAGGLKYGASQYKPMPAGTPTGFSSCPNQTGYMLSTAREQLAELLVLTIQQE